MERAKPPTDGIANTQDASPKIWGSKPEMRPLACSVGSKEDLDWFMAELRKKYELKEKYRLGPAPTDHKEAVILNRVVR